MGQIRTSTRLWNKKQGFLKKDWELLNDKISSSPTGLNHHSKRDTKSSAEIVQNENSSNNTK